MGFERHQAERHSLEQHQVERLLDRIGYAGPLDATLATLSELQRAFLLRVPFENLDIHLGRPIVLEAGALFDKVVEQRRGGFCYELNGLFQALLTALGFSVTVASARMVSESESGTKLGREFDHMVLLVELDRTYLADVGNGQSARAPLPLEGGGASAAWEGLQYRVRPHELGMALESRPAASSDPDRAAAAGIWKPRFVFSCTARSWGEFAGMCVYHQTSPNSHFPRQRMATLALADGRMTLSGNKLTVDRNGDRAVAELAGDRAVEACLEGRFGMRLGGVSWRTPIGTTSAPGS